MAVLHQYSTPSVWGPTSVSDVHRRQVCLKLIPTLKKLNFLNDIQLRHSQ